jgi:hypothetical protein
MKTNAAAKGDPIVDLAISQTVTEETLMTLTIPNVAEEGTQRPMTGYSYADAEQKGVGGSGSGKGRIDCDPVGTANERRARGYQRAQNTRPLK